MSPVPIRRSARIAAQVARNNPTAVAQRKATAQSQKAPQEEEKGDGAADKSSSTETMTAYGSDKASYTQYALNVFRASAPLNKNFVVCPLSLGSVLVMVMEGAKGKTKDEICNFLSQGDPNDTSEFYRTLMASMIKKRYKGVSVQLANSVIVDMNFAVFDEYKKHLEEHYKAIFASLDLSRGDDTAKIVNELIEKATKGVFSDVTDGSWFTSATAMLLINTITFEGEWAGKFHLTYTHSRTFQGLTHNRQEQFMHNDKCYAAYSFTKELTVVELPYRDAAWSLFLIMPSSDYKEWLVKMTGDELIAAMLGVKTMKSGNSFDLYLPKFSLEVDIDFKQILQDNNVSTCFSPAADFTEMTGVSGLFADKVTQKVHFEIDEEGTKAGAVTAYGITFSADNRITSIHFDKPFFFVLAKDRLPLFVGQFV